LWLHLVLVAVFAISAQRSLALVKILSKGVEQDVV
jgi:hypothetical protein